MEAMEAEKKQQAEVQVISPTDTTCMTLWTNMETN